MSIPSPGEKNELYRATVSSMRSTVDNFMYGFLDDTITPPGFVSGADPLPDLPGVKLAFQHAGDHQDPSRISLHTLEYITEPSARLPKRTPNMFRCVGTIANPPDGIDFVGVTQDGQAVMGHTVFAADIGEQFNLMYQNARNIDYDQANIDYDALRDGPSVEEAAALLGIIVNALYLKGINQMALPTGDFIDSYWRNS
jgi:hypothetical protein